VYSIYCTIFQRPISCCPLNKLLPFSRYPTYMFHIDGCWLDLYTCGLQPVVLVGQIIPSETCCSWTAGELTVSAAERHFGPKLKFDLKNHKESLHRAPIINFRFHIFIYFFPSSFPSLIIIKRISINVKGQDYFMPQLQSIQTPINTCQ
jgi:hypothetical protein